MSKWTKLSKKRPEPGQVCDFISGGNENESLTWMLCRATFAEFDRVDYDRASAFWRPAKRLPRGVTRFNP